VSTPVPPPSPEASPEVSPEASPAASPSTGQEPGLPPGLTTRPLTRADAAAVFEVFAASEAVDLPAVGIELADIESDWAKPSYDVSAHSVAVLEGDRVVACCEVMALDRGDAAVHPDHRGRGIGTWLAARMVEIARAKGAEVVGMPNAVGSPGDRLLERLGWQPRWHSWVLELPAGARIAERPLPDGHAVRAARPDEHEQVWTVLEDAFLEWSRRDREPFEDFCASVLGRPGFAPWNLRVLVGPGDDGSEQVLGAAVVLLAEGCGYVDRLAVRADRRHRGFAQALLVDSFAVARDHGATTSQLSTDSRTGALDLYRKVGMEVVQTWVNRATPVR